MVTKLTDKNFKKETDNGVVLIDFWATWCPPCKMQGPVVEEVDAEMGDKVKFTKLDVDATLKPRRPFELCRFQP